MPRAVPWGGTHKQLSIGTGQYTVSLAKRHHQRCNLDAIALGGGGQTFRLTNTAAWSTIGDKTQSVPHHPQGVMRGWQTGKGWKTMEPNRAMQIMQQGYV